MNPFPPPCPAFHPCARAARRIGLLLAATLLCTGISALDVERGLPQYNCRTWTRQDGLPTNGVNAITQGPNGYLWLGTSAGLVRFDGIEFDLFDLHRVPKLQSAFVTSVATSRYKGFWLGLRSGFAFSDGETVSAQSREEWGGERLYVQSVLEASNGDLWLGMQSGAARVTPDQKLEVVLPVAGSTGTYDVRTVYEDSTGRIWLGTTKGGLYFWRDGVLARFPDPALDAMIVRAVVEDKQGRIWIGTQSGLLCYDAGFRRLPMVLSTAETSVLFVDREGAVWAGTNGNGVVRYWHDVGATFQKSDGLTDDFVTAITEDHEGSVWIGTRNGLSQLADVKLPTYGKAEGIIGEVSVSVSASPRGGLWVATDVGLVHLDGDKRIEAYAADSGLGNTYIIAALEAKNGDVYAINGQAEVLVFSGGKIVARYPNKDWPTALVEDDQGMIVAAEGTLYRVSPTTYTPYLLADGQPVPLGYVFGMTRGADGCIWAAGRDEGIFQIKEGKITLWPVVINSRAATVLWVVEDDEGVVWAGSSTGLARLKDQRIQTYTTSDGLFDNVITSILPDQYGYLWVDSDRGFYRLSRRNLNDFADGKTTRVECTVYDGLDAVKSVDRNQQKPSGCRTLDGRIWFPTAQGVVMIDPTRLATNPPPPTVRIQKVRANLQELARDAKAIVPPGAGDLEFRYAGLSFIAPHKIQFRYMLDGYDRSWVDAGDRRLAAYTNLRPGVYTFRVEAANADGVWSETRDTLAIELLPHYYQAGWFYALCAGAVLALLAALYLWRVRVLRHRQRALVQARNRLEAEVQIRTADLARANSSLHHEVDEHKYTAEKLAQRTGSLEKEIEERKAAERQLTLVHKELLEISRQAGMAEVATGVLHNVGNVLNSVNVSTTLVTERLQRSELANLPRVTALLRQAGDDLAGFFARDPRGAKLPGFLESLHGQLAAEQHEILQEVAQLRKNVDHIKEIVAMQQGFARVSGVIETIAITDLIEDALRMNAAALTRHEIRVVRDFQVSPSLAVEKHKVLQILVNLIRNAKHACDDSGRPDKELILRVCAREKSVSIAVIDNGVGIVPENLTRIFSHGFTTRKDGHGFGLHSAALAATEMGGSLRGESAGAGRGATFILELPAQPPDVLADPIHHGAHHA